MDFCVSDLLISEEEFLGLREQGLLEVASAGSDAAALFLSNGSASELEVGLYLSPAVVSGLEQDNPASVLSAIEEISHILYACFKGNCGAQISALEMETQAEIDKYAVMARRYIKSGANTFYLPEYLYDCMKLHPDLTPEQHRRYTTAMSVAYFFIRQKVHSEVQEKRYIKAIKTLRQVYRLSGDKKLSVLQGFDI